MVRYSDIHKAIVVKIESKFADIEVTSNDVKEGFTRPSFFIEFDNIKASDFMNEALDREMTVRIYFFPSDRYKNKIEMLNVQDDLSILFLQNNIIAIDEFTSVEVQELDFTVVDKVLHCYFDIMLSEDYERTDDVENMEELQYKEM